MPSAVDKLGRGGTGPTVPHRVRAADAAACAGLGLLRQSRVARLSGARRDLKRLVGEWHGAWRSRWLTVQTYVETVPPGRSDVAVLIHRGTLAPSRRDHPGEEFRRAEARLRGEIVTRRIVQGRAPPLRSFTSWSRSPEGLFFQAADGESVVSFAVA